MRVQDYLENRVLNTPVGVPLINKRGWASVDLTVFGHSFRLVTTHLDVTPPFQFKGRRYRRRSEARPTPRCQSCSCDFNGGDIPNPPNPTLPTYQLLINVISPMCLEAEVPRASGIDLLSSRRSA